MDDYRKSNNLGYEQWSFNPHPSASFQFFAALSRAIDDVYRLCIYDTQSSKLLVEWSLPINIPCHRLVWGTRVESSKETKKSKRRRSDAKPESNHRIHLLAVPLANGEIHIYSPQHGDCLYKLSGGHSASVNDFVFSKNGMTGYSAGDDGKIVEWDLTTQTVKRSFDSLLSAVNRLALSEDGTLLLVADYQIKLWDLAEQKVVKTFAGHAHRVTELLFNKNDAMFLSMAEEDRYINVWDTSFAGPNTAIKVLRLDLAPVSMSLSNNDHVMVLAEDGTVFLFDNLKTSQKKKKRVETLSPKGLLSLKDSESNDQRPILASTFVDAHILFARGFSVKPVFETTLILDQEEQIIETLTLTRTFEKSALFNPVSQSKDLKKKKNEHVVGREDLTMDVMHLATPQASTDEEEEEPTLADKLNDMALRTPDASPLPKSQRSKPNANSLYTMLTQAIHSNDVQFLERCLNVDSNLVIHTTVRRLTPQQVVPLLDLLLNRMRTKFTRTTQLMEWIRAILLNHSSYLMTLPGIVTRLGSLYQHLDSRVATFQKLLRLSGRLDLVMSQIETRRKQADEDLDTERQVPAVVYEEEEEDIEEDSEEEITDMDALMEQDFSEEE